MKPSRAAQRRYIGPFQVPLPAAAPTETGRPLMVDVPVIGEVSEDS
jgi:hypothetical protein